MSGFPWPKVPETVPGTTVALPDLSFYKEFGKSDWAARLSSATGAFALVSRPFVEGRPWLRGLLGLWLAQNILLVVSALMRLDLYVDAFGLTRLRLAAVVWMGLVAGNKSRNPITDLYTRPSWLFYHTH